jgi:tetratricopeptide (TPR) repeat protein
MVHRIALALLFCAANHAVSAEEYWGYRYKDLDVTTVGSSGYAIELAKNIARFDTALSHILQLPETPLPTHIYVLPGGQVKALVGEDASASYKFSGYEATTIANPDSDPSNRYNNRYWGVLFGYTGALLMNSGASRFPHWFQVGVPQVFSHTEFEVDSVRTGLVTPGVAHTLLGAPLIPMRTFLSLEPNDPRLKGDYLVMYEAECWYLAREVFVEGKLRLEFSRYLALIKEGKSEAEAFASSFKIGYEDLDKLLAGALRETKHVFIVAAPRELTDQGVPFKLSPSEAKGRFADLSFQWHHQAAALQVAAEALQADPKNETALRVLARANLQQGNFEAAVAAVDRLSALSAPSAAAFTDCGDVLSSLAGAVSTKRASIGVDVETLQHRAQEAYEHAIKVDPEYLRSWAGLAYLYGTQRDVEAAKALVPKVQSVMEKHSYSGALARALAEMCSRTGQIHEAFLFAESWRDDAITHADQSQAEAFISRLKTQPPTTSGS